MEADPLVVKEAGLLLQLSMESAASLLGKGLTKGICNAHETIGLSASKEVKESICLLGA